MNWIARVGINADQAIQAANSYKRIVDALNDARRAALQALDAAMLAYEVREICLKQRVKLAFLLMSIIISVF